MEINILEQDKNKLKLEIKGEGHTLCNVLRKELSNDKDVKVVGYNIPHSLVGTPILILETEKESPKKALLSAIKRLNKISADLKNKFQKIK